MCSKSGLVASESLRSCGFGHFTCKSWLTTQIINGYFFLSVLISYPDMQYSEENGTDVQNEFDLSRSWKIFLITQLSHHSTAFSPTPLKIDLLFYHMIGIIRVRKLLTNQSDFISDLDIDSCSCESYELIGLLVSSLVCVNCECILKLDFCIECRDTSWSCSSERDKWRILCSAVLRDWAIVWIVWLWLVWDSVLLFKSLEKVSDLLFIKWSLKPNRKLGNYQIRNSFVPQNVL